MTLVVLLIFILQKRYEHINERYRNKKHSGKSPCPDVRAACDGTGCAGSVRKAQPDDALLLLNKTVLRLKYSVLVR